MNNLIKNLSTSFTVNRFAILLFALAVLTLHSCRKDKSLSPLESKDISSSEQISDAVLVEYFKTDIVGQFLTPDWTKAEQATINGHHVVKVPILNIDKSPKKAQSAAKISSGITSEYYAEHPPELFFVKVGDSLKHFLMNFVPTDRNKEFGQNGVWTGKLYEWNLKSDTLFQLQFSKSTVTKGEYSVPVANNTLGSKFVKGQNQISSFWSWLGDLFTTIWEAINWLGYYLGIPGSRLYDDNGNWITQTWSFLTDLGRTGDGGSGDGGSTDNGNSASYISWGGYGGYLPGTDPNDDPSNWVRYFVNPGGTGVPVFDPFQPFSTDDINIDVSQEWIDIENFYGVVGSEIGQQNISKTDPLPESYYSGGQKIDMSDALPTRGTTVLGFPRNPNFFWKKVAEQRPEFFSEANRIKIKTGSPVVDAQWIKYHPTHAAYLHETLVHHHIGQGQYAVAIPQKVHVKWSGVLHTLRNAGKINSLSNKAISLLNITQIFSLLLDINTGNPAGWVNWYADPKKINKLYYEATKDVYYEITRLEEKKDPSGTVIESKFYYNTYGDYVWDADEQRFIGVFIIGKFVETYYPQSNTSSNTFAVPMGD